MEDVVPSEHIPDSCRSGENGAFNTIAPNNEQEKAMYSMALAACLVGKPITLALSCTENRPPRLTKICVFYSFVNATLQKNRRNSNEI